MPHLVGSESGDGAKRGVAGRPLDAPFSAARLRCVRGVPVAGLSAISFSGRVRGAGSFSSATVVDRRGGSCVDDALHARAVPRATDITVVVNADAGRSSRGRASHMEWRGLSAVDRRSVRAPPSRSSGARHRPLRFAHARGRHSGCASALRCSCLGDRCGRASRIRAPSLLALDGLGLAGDAVFPAMTRGPRPGRMVARRSPRLPALRWNLLSRLPGLRRRSRRSCPPTNRRARSRNEVYLTLP